MGKVSPISIKYVIHANFIATGTIEKPDVIGAIFGQTEGLLGAELEMRELQKEGKIGRIDVNLETQEGKTLGKIEIPSALDKTETTIVAAALETIEKIGPSEAKIEIEKIEDVRGSKREYIIERAKKLLEQFSAETPESQEIGKAVTLSSRMSKLQSYGKDMLPAGDLSTQDIIVVEGRADVLNLLKHGINNVIGMSGTVLPKTIQELSAEKTLTLFLDGDRGGTLIAKNVIENADVDFVAFAPSGMEVEELSGKEIISALRKKISVDEFQNSFKMHSDRRTASRKPAEEAEYKKPEEHTASGEALDSEKREALKMMLYNLVGTKGAYVLNSKLEVIRKVPSSELVSVLRNLEDKIYAIVVDGVVTSSVIEAAEKAHCEHLIARNFASSTARAVNLISL